MKLSNNPRKTTRRGQPASHTQRAFTLLRACQAIIADSVDEQVLLERICRAMVELGGYRCVWVGYGFPDRRDANTSVYPVAQAGFRGELKTLPSLLQLQAAHRLVGMAIAAGEPCVVNRLPTSRKFAPLRKVAVEQDVASGASFPVRVHGQIVGALAVHSSRTDAFDAQEVDLLCGLVSTVSHALAAIRLREERDLLKLRMERALYFDSLTVLPNHLYFEVRLREELKTLQQGGRIAAVLAVGLDRIAELNDAFGFDHGDRVLREFAQRLRSFTRAKYLLARMRGNKFGLLVPLNETSEIFEFLNCLLAALRAPILIGELELDIRQYIGVSLFPSDHADPVALLRDANVALRQAKKQGRAYMLYEPEQDEVGRRRVGLSVELKRAIERDELLLHYQPKVDMHTRRICGVEALVRWNHRSRGLIPPDEFITYAEQSGLIGALTEWVLEAAWCDQETWRRAGLRLPVAVNLSALNLRDLIVVRKIEAQVDRSPVPWLELQITESAVIEDPDGVFQMLRRFADGGIKIFVDDFGIGYSTFGYLKNLPVTGVKIDKSFVIDMVTSQESATIVRAMINVAHDLSKRIIAEGVESQSVWDKLVLMGCDEAQGYHVCPPLPADQLAAFVKERIG